MTQRIFFVLPFEDAAFDEPVERGLFYFPLAIGQHGKPMRHGMHGFVFRDQREPRIE